MAIKAIITGATGMVGEGVMVECLNSPEVETVLLVNRKPSGFSHAKLKEIVLRDFSEAEKIKDQLAGYNACFFCLGVSSIGMSEQNYYKITYTLTMDFARVLSQVNSDMTFCYISGAGTDSTEKGRLMWARVKGKTENDLMKLPFKKAYAFRPGYIQPTPGQKNLRPFYKYITWLYPIFKPLFPNSMCTLSQIGRAMINAAKNDYPKNVLEVKDIAALAEK